jgi:predicted nucleotide-binding protein
VPHHRQVQAWLAEELSYGRKAAELAGIARHAANYLQKRKKMKGQTVARTEGPIFIGHGQSSVWKDLKDLLVDRLGLKYEEFNREPAAGVSTKERLLEMLDTCCFAFLVMTAEDEAPDGTKRARQNVIHEAGLFQGRYGFERAIILLEEGCQEFSNIQGLGHIQFPKGSIKAASEEIRRVLERGGILRTR